MSSSILIDKSEISIVSSEFISEMWRKSVKRYLGCDDLAIVSAFLLLALFFVWTAVSDGVPWRYGQKQKDYYNLLVDGLLDGQLSLKAEVSPALLSCADPYDPQQRPPDSALHDASLFNGAYYIYFGIVPALTLFLPFRLFTGSELPMGAAVLGVSLLGCGIALLLMQLVSRRTFPAISAAALFSHSMAFGLASPLAILLRRHSLYDLPIASAFMFIMAALLSLYLAILSDTRRRGWAAACGVFYGLAIGSRVTSIVATPCLLLLLFSRAQDGPLLSRQERFKLLLHALTPLLIALCGLGIYNYLRFGDILETGHRYQLSGLYEAKIQQFSPQNILQNIRGYFFAKGVWSKEFPFYRLAPILVRFGGDFGFCIAFCVPVVWLSLFSPIAWYRSSGRYNDEFRVLNYALIWTCFSFAAVIFMFYFFAVRYLGDFLPYLVFMGCLGSLSLLDRVHSLSRWTRLPVTLCILFILACSSLSVSLASLTAYNRMEEFNPNGYRALERKVNGLLYGSE